MIAADKTDANGALFSKVATAMVAYSICSSTLLLANKTTMIYLPRPGIINSVQIIFSLFFMFFVRLSGVNIDKLEWHKAKHYIIYVSAFTISRYANMKALQHSNVETVIVFRSCAPLAVSIVEFTLMGRSFPSLRSCSSLIAVCFGACLYCYSDSEFSVNGFKAYSWVSLYFLLLVFEMTYCKKLTASAKMKSKWGPVFYCNFLAAAPTLLLAFTAGEFEGLSDEVTDISFVGYAVLLFSCFAGTFIGCVSRNEFEIIRHQVILTA